MKDKKRPLKITASEGLLAKNIRSLREQKGWEQQELADKASLSRFVVGRIERCEAKVYFTHIEAIAKTLEVSIERLLQE